MVGTDKRLTIPAAFAALTVAQLIHSIEEVWAGLYTWLPRVTGYLRGKFDTIPQLSVSRTRFAFANIVVVAFMVAVSILLFRRVSWAVRVARAIAFVEILNGIAHPVAMIIMRRYFPGAFSAIGLIIFGVLFLRADYIERAGSHLDES